MRNWVSNFNCGDLDIIVATIRVNIAKLNKRNGQTLDTQIFTSF